MMNRLILIGSLSIVVFFVYVWSIAFDEDLRSRRGSLPYYLLIGKQIKSMYLPDGHENLYFRSFPREGLAPPFDKVEFSLPAGKLKHAVRSYGDYFSSQGCQISNEEKTEENLSIYWKCDDGEYHFHSSTLTEKNDDDGTHHDTDFQSIRIYYYDGK